MNINKWLYEYDKATLEKNLFQEVNFLSLYEAISKEKVKLQMHMCSETIPLIFQKKLNEFMESFNQNFEEMSNLNEDRYQYFSRLGFLYIHCERSYCQENWKLYLSGFIVNVVHCNLKGLYTLWFSTKI